MKNKKIEKIIITVILIFILLSVWYMFSDKIPFGNDGSRRGDSTVMPEANGSTDVIRKNAAVEQNFICSADSISRIGIVFVRDHYQNGTSITIELLQGNQTVAKNTYDTADIEEQHRTYVIPNEVLTETKNKEFTIKIYTDDSDTGLKILFSEKGNSSFRYGRQTLKGTLCFSVTE